MKNSNRFVQSQIFKQATKGKDYKNPQGSKQNCIIQQYIKIETSIT